MNSIIKIISQKNWDLLVSNSSPEKICEVLAFPEAMHVVEHLFYDDFQDDEKQQYALKLAFEIKEYFKDEWEKDWKNDIFLGDLCEVLWLYDERYYCYKRAYDKLSDPPEELLLLLSICNSAPGTPPITNEEAEGYLKKAAEKNVTSEVALAMRGLYKTKGNSSLEEYWNQVFKKLEKEGVHSEQIIPDVLAD